MEISNFYGLCSKINIYINNNANITNVIAQYGQQGPQFKNNQTQYQAIAFQHLDVLMKELSKLELRDDELQILGDFGFSKYFGIDNNKYFEAVKSNIAQNVGASYVQLGPILTDINRIKTSFQQLMTSLAPIGKTSSPIPNDMAKVEIIFAGKTELKNISACKEQMEDLYLVLRGYAQLFGTAPEDFEFQSITKHSPGKITIWTKLERAAVIITIVTGLMAIQKELMDDQMTIEKLKSKEMGDPKMQKDFIKSIEDNYEKQRDEKIEKLVHSELEKRQVETGDIKNDFKKGVEKQYNFIINGGSFNFQLSNPTEKQKVDELEKLKSDVQKIISGLEEIKRLEDKK